MSKSEAYDYAHMVQDLESQVRHGIITRKQHKQIFYEEIYEPLMDSYDIDMHAYDFYPKRSA